MITIRISKQIKLQFLGYLYHRKILSRIFMLCIFAHYRRNRWKPILFPFFFFLLHWNDPWSSSMFLFSLIRGIVCLAQLVLPSQRREYTNICGRRTQCSGSGGGRVEQSAMERQRGRNYEVVFLHCVEFEAMTVCAPSPVMWPRTTLPSLEIT